ncbi:MAG: glycine--tRNA ligase [Planctomycetota bacterium]
MAADPKLMENLTALCKRRGFIFPSSEIYGGINGFWDYGPLGVELKRNLKNQWWHDMVLNPPDGPDGHELDMVGLDCAIIMNPRVWVASGHVGGFSDPMQTCRQCKKLYRADQVMDAIKETGWYQSLGELNARGASVDALRKWAETRGRKQAPGMALVRKPDVVLAQVGPLLASLTSVDALMLRLAAEQGNPTTPCPNCGGDLTEPRNFNLMFETYVGAVRDEENKAYLRPETAQGIFANYKNVVDTSRVKVPFGIAQIGKAFRNEINPRNYTFRSREFEQMEIEFFCRDETSMEWYRFWRKTRFDWYVKLGLKSEKLRLRDQLKDELAHYSRACADIEYAFPFADGFQELEGVAHRGCFDLTQHQQHSGKDLSYFDDDAWEVDKDRHATLARDELQKVKYAPPYRYLPTVIEPSAGADRGALAFLCEAYTEDEKPDAKGIMQKRVFMRFHPKLAPIKAAFLPLVNKEGMPDTAAQIYRDAKRHMNAYFDDKGAIGRRYYRQDEAGTPFCVTVDGQTMQDGTVTIRDRDSLEQVRVGKDHVLRWLADKMEKPLA